MSRTYRNKIRIGICTGSNTNWYRERNRWQRHYNRHELRSKFANYDIDDLDDVLSFIKLPQKDSWSEPTDGSWLLDRLYLQQRLNRINNNDINRFHIPYDLYDYKYLKEKYARYLKPKHYKMGEFPAKSLD